MNAYDDVMRRLHFIHGELERIGHDPSQYTLIIGRQTFANLLRDMPPAAVATYHMRQAYLFGYRLTFADDRLPHYLALRHEVQG